jgi:hypothetical protein
MGTSNADELAAANLAVGNRTLGEILHEVEVRRAIGNTMVEIVRSGPIGDIASIIPRKPTPQEEPVRGTGWAKDVALETPLGESGQRLIEEIANSFLGPSVPMKRK